MTGAMWRNVAVVVGVVVVVGAAAWIKSGSNPAPPDPTTGARPERANTTTTPPEKPVDPRSEEGQPTAAMPEKALPRLIDLGADKCIPCKKMAPILEELKKEWQGRAVVQFIDVWKNPDASKQYGVRLIPTQIFFDRHGKEAYRHEGFFSRKDIVDWLEILEGEE